MRNPNKFVVGLAALVVVVAVGIYLNRKPASPPAPHANPNSVATHPTNRPPVHVQQPPQAVEEAEPLDKSSVPRVPREKVEEYVTRHHRDTASLLAAFHALQDTNYLLEAATNFPNNPQLQWTILAQDAFPADRRKWLDAFKTSSPNNSLANYLSAQDYFKNNQPEAAMKELTAAAGKSQFADFSMETILDAEDLYRFNGSSSSDMHTGAIATVSDTLKQLSQLKDVARGLQELQHQYATAGDTASVRTLALMGIDLGNRIATGDIGKFAINQLVANATQAIALESLDQNTSYAFLGGQTPAQRLADFQQQRAALRELNKSFTAAAAVATEDQMNAYWERSKIYGGWPAAQWLVQQTATTPSTGN